ncbi:unnamed protein product [Mytilus coruscus]|uniref:Uncharacterized protein n=1 Tax=Mytilus coruscus TaxID=42192 RepID=A0A6J8EK98_MYTCO|nr:unnamed protein product [Mytilus coruscus]
MKDYLSRVNKRGECVMKYYERHNFGRYWTNEKLGLQNMSRKIRHTLCKDYMYDINMKNAHPTLLSWYCHENKIECSGLDSYINHREEYMGNWMLRTGETRDEVKAHCLAIIYGRRVKLQPNDPSWYKNFYIIMRNINESIIKLRPELYPLAKKSKHEKNITYNIDGTTVNYVALSLENKALMIAFDYLTKQNIEVGALVFDGLMVYKEDVSELMLPELYEKCSAEVKKVMGYDITFTNKVMDEGKDNKPEDFKPYFELFSSSSSSSSSSSNNDDDVCDHNFVLFDDRVKQCLTCGVEQMYNRFSNGNDFECWNLGKTFHKSKHPPQQPTCTSKTIRGH